ncbi:MAG: 3',5'-cyclic-nucleotide phosphodiesterase, partial [Pseudomonadota bacterium]
FAAVDVEHTVPSQGYVVSSASGTFAVSGDTRTNETLWPVLNAVPSLTALIVEVSFPNEQIELATEAGHYVPATMASDLARLQHDPAIWLNAMKPGEEERILAEVRHALPGRDVQMLTIGTELSI